MKCVKKIVGKRENEDIIAYNVVFDNGFEVEILNLGGIITKIIVPDKDNKFENVVVGYKNIESYITNPSYFGAIIGRTAGRICDARIIIDDKSYNLSKNYDTNQGHGGYVGFDKKIWNVEVLEEVNNITLKMETKSLDGEENYPGNLDVIVSYKIYNDYKIEILYEAISDKNTLINMTNHSYFNLSGNLKSPITQQYMKLDSEYMLEIDESCVPTGNKINVKNTPFDFTSIRCIGDSIDSDNYQINIGKGYNHPFLLNGDKNIYLEDRSSKRAMKISTNQKSVVVYSMNFTDDEVLYNGKINQRRYGICFETQSPPIGKDMCFIDDSFVRKNEKYIQKTTYEFFVNRI